MRSRGVGRRALGRAPRLLSLAGGFFPDHSGFWSRQKGHALEIVCSRVISLRPYFVLLPRREVAWGRKDSFFFSYVVLKSTCRSRKIPRLSGRFVRQTLDLLLSTGRFTYGPALPHVPWDRARAVPIPGSPFSGRKQILGRGARRSTSAAARLTPPHTCGSGRLTTGVEMNVLRS